MSTLTYAKRDLAPAVPAHETPLRKPFWSRFFDALVASQQRRAEREIARYLASHGHLLNDAGEREIMRRLAGDTRRPQ
jgi:hypothetical protein